MHRDEKKGSDNRRYYTRTSGHTRTSSPRGNAFVPCSTLARFLSSPPPPPRSIISLTVPCIKHVIVSFDPSLPFLLLSPTPFLRAFVCFTFVHTVCIGLCFNRCCRMKKKKKKRRKGNPTKRKDTSSSTGIIIFFYSSRGSALKR